MAKFTTNGETRRGILRAALKRFAHSGYAAASVAQVHAAQMPDGREVVVKVIRPDIQGVIADDLALLDWLAHRVQALGGDFQRLRPVQIIADYRRTLDLDRAVATVRYRVGEATYTREVFSSFPDQLIVVRLTCDRPGKIGFTASADSLLRYAVQVESPDTLVLRGRAPATMLYPSVALESSDRTRWIAVLLERTPPAA